MLKRIAAAALLLTLAACGSSDGNTSNSESEASTSSKLDAKKALKIYEDGNGGPIKDSCDAEFTQWQCYFDSVKANGSSRLDVKLSTPGDISESEAKNLSKAARTAWFNFIGEEYADLEMVVTFVNGVDTGTTQRADVPLLNR